MATLNIDADFGALPTITSYAVATTGGIVTLESGGYHRLPEGVSTVTFSARGTTLEVYLSTAMSSSGRYARIDVEDGQPKVVSSVSVPEGKPRYIEMRAAKAGDVGVTIITYPLV